MSKNRRPSHRLIKKASKTLRRKNSSGTAKSLAGYTLGDAPGKRGRKPARRPTRKTTGRKRRG